MHGVAAKPTLPRLCHPAAPEKCLSRRPIGHPLSGYVETVSRITGRIGVFSF